MAPMKPSKRSQSTQSYHKCRMKIKRESVKPKRESTARTPSTVPVDVQEAPCGVYRVPDIPDNCRKGRADAGRARRAFVAQLTTQYAQQNKIIVGARWMADGLALDWANGTPALTREAAERNAQRNRGRYNSFSSRIARYRPRVHSKRPPRASSGHRSPEYAQAAAHRYGSNSSRLKNSRTLPSDPRRPVAMQHRRAPLNPDINQEEPSDRFQYTPSSHSLGHASIAPAPAAQVPMRHSVPQGQISNQQPYSFSPIHDPRVYSVSSRENNAPYRTEDSSVDERPRSTHPPEPNRRHIDYNDENPFILRPLRPLDNPSTVVGSRVGVVVPSSAVPPLVKDITGNSFNASKNSPMGKQTQPPKHSASRISPAEVLTDAHDMGGAKGQSPYSEGTEFDVSMEYEGQTPATDIDTDDNTMEVQSSGDSEDQESSVGPSPRVSVHREESPPVTRSSEKLRVPLYKVASNMPIPLPKASFARARRLLIPSDPTKPIAWASMPGDMHFIDSSTRTRITRYSLPATDEQRFCLADACRLGDGYYIQAHIGGPYRFSIIKAPSGTRAPERSHLFKMKPNIDPGINTIISIGDRDFVTGNNKHIIRFWRLLSEEEGPQVTRTEAIKGRHKSAVKALAMGDNTLWSSSGYQLLGTDVPSMQTVLEPITRASRPISQIHYHQRFLTLETQDHDTPFRVYDTRTINSAQDEPVVKFGLSPHKSPSRFRKGAWINTTFAHGFTNPVTKVEQLLLWDLRKTSRPTQTFELGHTVTHCVFWKGGKEVVVTGDHHVSFLHL